MRIPAISSYQKAPNFGKIDKDGYENPIDRKKERQLAILGCTGGSLLAGATAFGISTCFFKEGAKALKKFGISGAIGAVVTAAVLALTLPSRIYNAKVNATVREKEMGVFTRDREVKSNLLTQVDNEVQDEEVPLEQKLDHYATMQMANKGSGLMLKSM